MIYRGITILNIHVAFHFKRTLTSLQLLFVHTIHNFLHVMITCSYMKKKNLNTSTKKLI